MDGRHFYIKEGNVIWSPAFLPAKTPSISMNAAMAWAILFRRIKNQLSAKLTCFVPLNACEIEEVEMTNQSKTGKSFSLFAQD
jgi:cellobiose phosphorylase